MVVFRLVPAAVTTVHAIAGIGKWVSFDIYSDEYNSNNLSGIKTHDNPRFVYVNTHEFINGVKNQRDKPRYDAAKDDYTTKNFMLMKWVIFSF